MNTFQKVFGDVDKQNCFKVTYWKLHHGLWILHTIVSVYFMKAFWPIIER
jgi:hypothetical protein